MKNQINLHAFYKVLQSLIPCIELQGGWEVLSQNFLRFKKVEGVRCKKVEID